MIRRLLCWLGFHKWGNFIASIPDGTDNNFNPKWIDFVNIAER